MTQTRQKWTLEPVSGRPLSVSGTGLSSNRVAGILILALSAASTRSPSVCELVHYSNGVVLISDTERQVEGPSKGSHEESPLAKVVNLSIPPKGSNFLSHCGLNFVVNLVSRPPRLSCRYLQLRLGRHGHHSRDPRVCWYGFPQSLSVPADGHNPHHGWPPFMADVHTGMDSSLENDFR